MREILFKAKRIDNGEWIEGSLIDLDIDSGYCYIVPPYIKESGRMILSNIISEKSVLQSNMDAIKIVLILRKQNMSDSM